MKKSFQLVLGLVLLVLVLRSWSTFLPTRVEVTRLSDGSPVTIVDQSDGPLSAEIQFDVIGDYRLHYAGTDAKRGRERDIEVNLPGIVATDVFGRSVAKMACEVLMNVNGRDIIDAIVSLDDVAASEGWSISAIVRAHEGAGLKGCRFGLSYLVTNPTGTSSLTEEFPVALYADGRVELDGI